MNTRNVFIIRMNDQLKDKSFEDRTRVIKRILADLDATDILKPIDVSYNEEDDFDFNFHKGVAKEPENVILWKDEEIQDRIRRKQEELATMLGVDKDEVVKTPFGSTSVSRFGRSPLHEAIVAGDIKTVTSLIEQGLYLDAKDNNGLTALALARLEENIEIINIFEKHGHR